MRNRILLALAAMCAQCWAATYYVSNAGTDAPGCTTAATACKTLAYVDSSIVLYAGDSVLLQRGGVWNEQLVAPASGTSGGPITYDAYGTGPAPVITAAAPILPWIIGTGTPWSYVSGSTWKATVATTIASATINMVQFGALYGRKQPYGSGCASSIVSKYDWCLSWPYLYVYSAAGVNPVTTYATDGAIVPIFATSSGLAMIAVAGRNWLTFQHIKVQSFDYMGVSVTGGADNLVFANMEVDGMVPRGATPLGFYVNATNPGNIQFLNDEGLFGGKSGAEKKDAAMSFLESALATVDAVAAREIIEPVKFREGISKIIDGTVECLNASTWTKGSPQASAGPQQ